MKGCNEAWGEAGRSWRKGKEYDANACTPEILNKIIIFKKGKQKLLEAELWENYL